MGLVAIDWNNPEEVREYKRKYAKKYRDKRKKEAEQGNEKAKAYFERGRKTQAWRSVKSFLKNQATLKQVREAREVLLEREKELKEKNKKSIDN
ncbi:hypothetical protein FOF68_00305 [Lactobacillus jensenii]|nr:hypothetical protein HMPREF0527_00168 [Lactobacillus jensenii SJ-7A-US]MBS5831887.1 hypothetical protein [Lactobacillus jensenii]PLA45028.1 hypothetical protein CYJ90_02120 [Lactobacillus jensenii]TVV09107.1 hypothetical protein FOF68_00305 [Lactobacillus jensenii]TVV17846.1 hypothetical protein FOF61_00155 [Lactobacillus jensenii]